MSYNPNNDVLDFEDLIEFVTPGTIERRVKDLDVAWQALKFSNNDFVQKEIKAWDAWSRPILDSWFARFSGASISNELDVWHARYENAYNMAKAGGIAPAPSVFKELKSGANLTPVLVGLGIGLGLFITIKILGK